MTEIRRLGPALFLAIVLIAGCSAGPSSQSETSSQSDDAASAPDNAAGSRPSPPPSAASPGLTITPQAPPVANPLDSFRLTDEEKDLIYETWQLGIAKCMRDAGFEYVPVQADDFPPEPSLATEPDLVLRYGYGIPSSDGPAPGASNDKQIEENAAFRVALIGEDGESGCRSSEQRRAFGDDTEFGPVDGQIAEGVASVLNEVMASDAYANLNDEWSDCMRNQGYSYPSPGDAIGPFADPEVSPGEVETRVADLNCQAAVDYDFGVSEIMAQISQAWIDANIGLTTAWTSARDSYLADVQSYRAEP